MIRNEYFKPNIKVIPCKPYLMQELSVINTEPPIDDEGEILATDPLNPWVSSAPAKNDKGW